MPFKLAISNFTIGRHYEKVVIAILRTYSFHIWHSGRSGDKGVDFTGSWVLPNKEVPVIGQCKWSDKRQLSPHDVRAFAGTATSVSSAHVRLLVSCTGFSNLATSVAESLPMPVVMCRIRTLPEWLLLTDPRNELCTAESMVDLMALDHAPLQTSADETVITPPAIVDQFTLNRMARALLPEVCVVRCWEKHDHLRGRLMLLLKTDETYYNLGDVTSRDPQTGKAIDWCHVCSV